MSAQSQHRNVEKIIAEAYPADAPGAAVLIVHGGDTLMNHGFGLANLETGTAVTPGTQFRMASVSKQFTAMCIIILANNEQIRIQDPVIKYLPGLPDAAKHITIRQLMMHTSGIPDYEPLIPEGQDVQVTDADVLRLIGGTNRLFFEPGSAFKYSNTAFCLLTQIVEKVTGIPYPQFIRQSIFLPLGMDHTMIYNAEDSIFRRAYGYRRTQEGWKFADQSLTSATMGDGSVYTSLDEYAKWIRSLWAMKHASESANPLYPQVEITSGMHYGYGWFMTKEADGSTALFHSGESTGFRNMLYHNPSKRFLAVLFSNSDDRRASETFDKILKETGIQLPVLPPGIKLFDYLSAVYED